MKSCTIAKIPYIGGLTSFIGLAIMILTGMTRLGAILGASQAVPILYVT